MTIEFELSEADLVRFSEHHAQHSLTMRRLGLFLRTATPLALFVGFTYAYRATPLRAVFLGVVTALVYLGLSRFAGPSLFRGVVRQSLKEGSLASVLGKQTLVVDESGIAARNAHGDARIRWTGVDRIEEAADYVYVFTQPAAGLVVPKRAFDSPQAASAFVARLRELKSGVEQADAADKARL